MIKVYSLIADPCASLECIKIPLINIITYTLGKSYPILFINLAIKLFPLHEILHLNAC